MTRLAWITDPHFDHIRDDLGLQRFAEELRASGAEAVVMTGDLAEAPSFARYVAGIAEGARVDVHYVLGNHDFYRGDVAEARESARHTPNWLDESDPVDLGSGTCLIGVGGFYDFRAGRGAATRILMNDWLLIRDFRGMTMDGIVSASRALAEQSAALVTKKLSEARASGFRRAFVATHVPPFLEAARHEGAVSDADWAPIMVNQAMGDALVAFAQENPTLAVDVLCGHTHTAWDGLIVANLRVRVGRADYGRVFLTVVE